MACTMAVTGREALDNDFATREVRGDPYRYLVK
jgi:hypothetical protein